MSPTSDVLSTIYPIVKVHVRVWKIATRIATSETNGLELLNSSINYWFLSSTSSCISYSFLLFCPSFIEMIGSFFKSKLNIVYVNPNNIFSSIDCIEQNHYLYLDILLDLLIDITCIELVLNFVYIIFKMNCQIDFWV